MTNSTDGSTKTPLIASQAHDGAMLETLEPRLLFSTAPVGVSKPGTLLPTFEVFSRAKKKAFAQGELSPAATTSNATGTFPAVMRSAYGVTGVSFNGVAGDGTGQTIALIDAYNDPNIASDLSAFDSTFGLSAPPVFKVENQNGSTSSLPQNSGSSGWSLEESLDVEWAHVMAPGASIIVFEASSASESNLFTAAETAAATPDVATVSMSFGGSEFSGENSYDSDFQTPAGHTGVTFFASTGDSGAQVLYPAESPDVVAVGGTSLYLSGSSYSSETAWSSGGGGTSAYETQPAFQANAISSYYRTTPDVSIDADPDTGVPVYDTYDNGTSKPWILVGGTSLASPMWAGLVAVADQGRVAEGLTALTTTQTLTRLYQLPANNFHDITAGSNGHSATAGYDLATGIGTPVANRLVSDLAGVATISGRVFVDNNGDGIYDNSDTPLSGMTVYLDLNNDGVLDNGDISTTTSATGTYSFSNQSAGGTVRLSSPAVAGYVANPTSATVAYGSSDTINFTYFPTTISSSTAGNTYTLQTDPTNTNEQILVNGVLTYSVAKATLGASALKLNLTGAGDVLDVNGANGDPVPTGGVTVNGAASGDALTVSGTTSGDDAFIASSNALSFNGNTIHFSNVSLLSLNPGAGIDSLNVSSGLVTITPQTPGDGILVRNFSFLNVAAAATLIFSTAALHTDRMLIETAEPAIAGSLDLGGNDMIIHNGNLSAITALLAAGYNNGSWNGAGISSSAAHNDPEHLTALGSMQNTLYGGTGQPRFDGVNPQTSDVLIKYTYYGDTNLDGTVDGTDYSHTDFAYSFGGTGWANGDFNYDNSVDGSDYALIDNAFNQQGSAL